MDTHPTCPPKLWDRTPPAVQAYMRTLEARLAALEELESRLHRLPEQVRILEEQLNQPSRHSSRPPSSDPPRSPRPPRRAGQRRRGGQPGHCGHSRSLLPIDEVREGVPLKPERCAGCQAPLRGDDPSPFRHQVIEIPPIRPVLTEYQWHPLGCPDCGDTTRAPWPDGVPRGPYGARGHATVALGTGAYRLAKRTTAEVMADLFGGPMSVGTLSQSETRTTSVLAKPVEPARDAVEAQAVAQLDETSWRQSGKRAWLGVAVTSVVTVFALRLSRGGQVARELLGEKCGGILVTARYSGSNWSPVRWRQLGWAPLLRDFEAMRGRQGGSEEIGAALLAQAHQMFAWWHWVHDGTWARSTFRSYMTLPRREVERLWEGGSPGGVATTDGTCREMLKCRQALWTFGQGEGGSPPPTRRSGPSVRVCNGAN